MPVALEMDYDGVISGVVKDISTITGIDYSIEEGGETEYTTTY